MIQTLTHGSTEYNMEACSVVQIIAQQNLLPPDIFTNTFLKHLITSIESKDTVAADSWVSTLLVVIEVIPSDILEKEVFPVFAKNAHISKPVPIRVVSCKVLGCLATLLPTQKVVKEILPIIISLCQDVAAEVRAAMCKELPNASHLLNLDHSKYLFNIIVDLTSDENSSVREAALESVAELIQFIPQASIKNTIIPLTKKSFLKSIEAEDESILTVARIFGLYCIRLKDYLSHTDKAWFIDRYTELSQLSTLTRKKDPFKLVTSSEEKELNLRLTQCRQKCAYNFPAMVLFTADLQAKYSDSLPNVLQKLSSDSYFLVRRSIASGFHEIFKLQPKWVPLLEKEFLKFLGDKNEKVLEGLVPNIGVILRNFAEAYNRPANDKKEEFWVKVGHALLACEKMLFETLNWRLHEQFLTQLAVVNKTFPAKFVNQYIVPRLSERTTGCRTLPCKMAAVRIFLLIMADDIQAKQKQKMRNEMLELCNSSNFYVRMTFVRAMTLLLDISPKLLKEEFFLNIMAMTDDKVPNIRLAVCKIMPKLKAIVSEPYDRKLFAAIDSSVRRLGDEDDIDVMAQIKIMNSELDEVDGMMMKIYKPAQEGVKSSSESASENNTKACYQRENVNVPGSGMSTTVVLTSRKISITHNSTVPAQRRLKRSTSSSSSEFTSFQNKSSSSFNNSAFSQLEDNLPTDAFIIDAGISLLATDKAIQPASKSEPEIPENSYTIEQEKVETDSKIPVNNKIQGNSTNILKPIRRLPTPRPTHRFPNFSGCLSNSSDSSGFENPDKNTNKIAADNNHDKICRSLVMENQNSSVLKVINKKLNERPSGLPLKINQTNKLSIEDTSSDTDVLSQNILKNKQTERFKLQPNKTADTKKRHSLNVDVITNRTVKMPSKFSNINKRYSLTAEVKKEIPCKNSLTYVNNNTIRSSKLAVAKNQPRPQSCLLKDSESEIFNNTKRSMSVENLPPKTIRSPLVSRLPVRAADPKTSKSK